MHKRGLVLLRLAFCATALSFPLQPALALDPSGTALAVIQSTSADGPGGARVLEAQKPVYSGDQITTGAKGNAQIQFRDETRLVVGPNSSLRIDKFVFNPAGTATAVAVNAAKGAFRFISGNSPSQVYAIKTPSASIGVRGTQFDVAIGERGETGVLLFDGAVRLCGTTGRCIDITQACDAALALEGGSVGRITARRNRNSRIAARFPLVANQRPLLPAFRVSTAACAGLSDDPGGPGITESSGTSSGPDAEDAGGGGNRGGGGKGGTP